MRTYRGSVPAATPASPPGIYRRGRAFTLQRRPILGVERWRAVDRTNANAGAVINPHVPNGLAVARGLPVQMRGPWVGHVVHQRTTSRSGSRAAER